MKICAQCGNEIPVGERYLKVCDNFLQRRYFDAEDESDNVFCSKDCLCEALSVMEFEVLPDGEEGGAKQKRDGIINCGYCPIRHQYHRDCTLAWAQMPYEKGVQ